MCWYGCLYDIFLGTLLRSVRLWIALKIRSRHWFPVLDLCCGTGDQLRRIDHPKRLTVGVDRDFSLLFYARSRSPVIPWVCADAGSLPFHTSSFRCVLMSFSLHEKSPDFRQAILEEAKRVVKNDGCLLFLDYENPWNTFSVLGSLMIWTIEKFAGGDHFRFYRHFMASGGLRRYLAENDIPESESRLLQWGSSRIVMSQTNKSE
jgi:ubiquinone/menaquinone biosynthesis C-methylase UbiE